MLTEREAACIERAAELAWEGRFGEAENFRARAGYGGRGVLDFGAVSSQAESIRRRMLDTGIKIQ